MMDILALLHMIRNSQTHAFCKGEVGRFLQCILTGLDTMILNDIPLLIRSSSPEVNVLENLGPD